jgi:hypothetical protein
MLLMKKNERFTLKTGFYLILLAGMMVMLQACFPYGPEDIEEFDIVGTFYDKNINFGQYTTYAMPDSIAKINNSGTTSENEGQYDDLILSQVAANLNAVGYQRVEDPEEADVVVTVAITLQGYNLYSNYDYSTYWGYYTPGYGSGYDYGYSGYDGQTYDLKTGTVLINMADLSRASDTTIPAIWVSFINGITEQSYTNTSKRLITLINRCFSQSPYLGTSN